jgi:hypothetical protein
MHKAQFYLNVMFSYLMTKKKLTFTNGHSRLVSFCHVVFLLSVTYVTNEAACVERNAIIVAKVGKDVVTNIDVDNRCKMIALFSGKENDTRFIQNIRLQVIQKLIDEAVLEQMAIQFKIDVNSDNVYSCLEDYAKTFGLKIADFVKLIEKYGIYNSLVATIRARLITSYIVMSASPKELTRVSEKQINKEIAKIKENDKKTQYSVLEIVFNSKDKVEAQNAAEKAHSELTRQSESEPAIRVFQTMAQQLSQSTTSQDSGYVGWVVDGQLDEVSNKTIKSLDVGTFSKPVKIRDGEYKIFFLNDIKQPGCAPYSETRIVLCVVSVPFDPSTKNAEQVQIQSKIDALTKSTSEKELREIAKDFGLTARSITTTLAAIPKELATAQVGKRAGAFFSGKSIEVIWLIDKKSSPIQLKIDKVSVQQMLEHNKKAMYAERLCKDFKNRTLIQLQPA